jgi:hypothetical protein
MKFRAREILLLILGWLVAAALLVGLVVVYRSRYSGAADAPGPSPTYTVVFTQVTASGLYPAAEALALTWQPDAQLASTTATWPEAAADSVGEPTEWVFRFYSPSQRGYYFVSIQPDGQAQGIEHARKVDLPPPVIPVDAWRVDSVEALATWLDHGGGAMLETGSGIEVSAQLNVPTEGGEPTWAVVGFDTGSNDYLTVMIHADSGQVLQTADPSP